MEVECAASTGGPASPFQAASMSSKRDAESEPGPATAAVEYKSLGDLAQRVEIYRGRHSVVWTTACRRTRVPLILKAYMKAKMSERNYHQVKREIRLMQQINYAGTVKLLGAFQDDSAIYLVQELCAEGDLLGKLNRSKCTLDESYVVGEVILPLLLTLSHLHHHKIYHRDIKPENIFIFKGGAIKLGDFGLAIDATLERAQSRVGTLDYMSPEVVGMPTADERLKAEAAGQALSQRTYTEKVDVWACGILAYELLVGKPPFEVKCEKETKRRILHETTLCLPPHVSADAVAFIQATLAKSADLRPTANELLHHPWVAPHLLALVERGGLPSYSDVGLVRAAPTGSQALQGHAPSLLPGTNRSPAAPGQGSTTAFSAPGPMGPYRAASFSSAPPMAKPLLPWKVQAAMAEGAGGHFAAGPPVASPHAPATPGPYGPPGLLRKPVWEMDSASSFTAVSTTGLGLDVPLSPSGAQQTKPTALSAAAGAPASGGNPLLKAALNANLGRIAVGAAAVAVAAPGQLISAGGVVAAAALPGSVKQRLKEYFVARNM